VTVLVFPAAAARAGRVALHIGEGLPHDGHDGSHILPATEQVSHEPHGEIDVVEEILVPGTEVVEPRLAIGGGEEAILGASSMTGEAHITVLAVERQRVALIGPELALLRRGHQLQHMFLTDVAQQIVGLDKMITGVEIAIVLHGQRVAAGFIENANPRGGHLQPVGQGRLKGLDKHPAHVMHHPFIEDGAEELPKLLGPDRPVGDGGALLVQGTAIGIDAFDDGNGKRYTSRGKSAFTRLTVTNTLNSTPCF